MPNIIPIRDLKNTSAISDLCKKSNEPLFVTKNGYEDMLIMSMEIYVEKIALLDVYQKLMIAEEECKNGHTVNAKESLKKLISKI